MNDLTYLKARIREQLRMIAAVAFALHGCAQREQKTPDSGESIAAVNGASTITAGGLRLRTLMNSCGANQAQDFFEIANTATSPITLSDISIKLWINDTSGQEVVPHIWTGGCLTNASGCFHQVAGVTASATAFSPGCGPDPNHQASWEITISNTDSTQLAPGVVWTNIQSALNLANYSNFQPGTDTWYSPCLPGSSYTEDAHFAVYLGGSLVFSSTGINAPTCRSPRGQQVLGGHFTTDTLGATCQGVIDPTTPIALAVGLPVNDLAALKAKIQQVSDPNSSSYAQYLTPDQFAATFGPSAASQQAIVDWANGNGLTVSATYPSRLVVDVSGTAAQVERALFTNLRACQRPDGTAFFAPDRQPSLAATTPVEHISGLDTFFVARPKAGVGAGPGGLHASGDIRAAYASCSTSTGAGESVGLFELDGFKASDITLFECTSGLATCDATNTTIVSGTVPPVQTRLIDGYSGGISSTAAQLEVTVDLEMAIAMAPGLSNVVAFEAGNDGSISHTNDILAKMASDTTIRQFSCSWVVTGDPTTQNLLYQMATQGQSFFVAVGDRGSSSWTLDPSEVPVSLFGPDLLYSLGLREIDDLDAVTIVGGTTLNVGGTPVAYQSETTWNVTGEGAGGGGVASFVTSPFYQAPFSNAIGAGGKRVLPDVSMVATGLYGVVNGSGGGFVGTSFASPLWAGYAALANSQRAINNVGPIGFANTFLYDVGLAAPAIYNGSFNDIADNSSNAGSCASGIGIAFCNNWTASATGGNSTAGTGYDLATGLGTPKCFLLQELGTASITVPPAPGGGGPSIALVATEGDRGVEFCMQGAGFTPGHLIQFKYLNLPGFQSTENSDQGPLIVPADGNYTNFDPTFGGRAASIHGFVQNCTQDELNRTMTVQVTQLDDPSLVATATISNKWICGAMPLQDFTNETPLPFPPEFGQRTCPLPPD
ncbi:MAG TPA: protease pro-enzyme activation domain-containing protein [Kofleriaceae bacterium]|jgi:hypothetical protein